MTEEIRRQGLSSFDDLLQESLAKDEAFAERWKIGEVVARFGVHVFKERTRQGVSQEMLAEEVGTGQPNISRVEHGAANPTLETMAKIARALDVDLVELLRPQRSFDQGVTVYVESKTARPAVGPGGRKAGPKERWAKIDDGATQEVDARDGGFADSSQVVALAS